jgi:hypothetical protein
MSKEVKDLPTSLFGREMVIESFYAQDQNCRALSRQTSK